VIDGMKAIVLPIGVGIAGQSAENNGNVINIKDAYLDDRFNSAFDKKSGYRTKSILCIPVYDTTNKMNTNDGNDDDEKKEEKEKKENEKRNATPKLLGIFQMINKLEGFFTKDDELLVSQFGRFVSNKIIWKERTMNENDSENDGKNDGKNSGDNGVQDDNPNNNTEKEEEKKNKNKNNDNTITVDDLDGLLSTINKWKRNRKRRMEDEDTYQRHLSILSSEARDIVGCDRCTLFLVGKLFSQKIQKIIKKYKENSFFFLLYFIIVSVYCFL
jgi:hypothetical protein